MQKLDQLILAMMQEEGWRPIDPILRYAGSSSYRRHNPLNLRSSPFQVANDNGFAVFRTDADGLAAAKWDILQKIAGNTKTGLNADSTLQQLIAIWAPKADGNQPLTYLQHVLTRTGFSATMKLRDLS